MRQLMAEDVNKHWFREQEKDDEPAGRASEERHPESVDRARGADYLNKRSHCATAEWEQKNGNQQFEPFRHAAAF